MTKQIVDQSDREKIKYELDKNFLVEAGAGSGKTTSLVERMVNLIRFGYQIHEIVAITFTRKAADELKNRFQSQLEKAWKMESDREIKSNLETALHNVDQCFLGTVHSFCAQLLRERPVEAQLDLHFNELEEQDDRKLVEIVWERYLTKLRLEDPQALAVIAETGIHLDKLKDSLQEMKNYPDVLWFSTRKEKPDVIRVYKQFISLLKEANRAIPDSPPEKGYDALQQIIIQAIRKNRFQPKLKEYQMIETFELFDKKRLKPTQKKWRTKEDAKEYDSKIKIFFEDQIKDILVAWKEFVHPIVVDFLKPAFVQYEQLKRERSLLNFQDLLMKSAQLLKENSEVRQYFQKKYRCLLIDEFQDTDPIQAEIMFYLTSEDICEQNWVNCKPRPGSLFVVGDPKQAIYRFRRADIDTYNRVKDLICSHGGEVLQLTMNFRTVDNVTAKLNNVFETYLPEIENTYQAAFRPLNSFKEAKDTDFTGILKLNVAGDKKEDVIQNDAEMIALTISSLIKKGYPPKEFMVLTRYNDGIDIYTRTLQNYGIPVSVSGEMVIGETQEFQELLLLLDVFLDSTNSVSFVAVLRSVFFGISDDELYQWKEAGGTFKMNSQAPENLLLETKAKFENVLNKLQTYKKWVKKYSPTVAIEKMIEDIGFYALLIAKNYGQREYVRLKQLISAIRKAEENGETSFHAIVKKVTEMVQTQTRVVNLGNDDNAVQIMNVHKAKGLEAPIVFLAHPAKIVDSAKFLSHHIKREDQISNGFFTFSKPYGFGSKIIAQPPNWEQFKAEELNYLYEEEIRILYVAATRAEKAIFISSWEGKSEKSPWNPLVSVLNNLEEYVLEEEVEQIENEHTSIFVTYQDFEAARDGLLTWKEKSLVPTYGKFSSTVDKDEIYTLEIDREAGGGKNWGLLVHELFEKLVKGQDMIHAVPNVLKKYAYPVDREEEIWSLIRDFQASLIWSQLQSAEIVLTEVPITLKMNPTDQLYEFLNSDNSNYPVIATGIIDLIYKYEGQWVIVDYKTDRPKEEGDLKKLTEYYQKQLLFYASAWEQLTGDKVHRTQIYFVTFNKFIEIN